MQVTLTSRYTNNLDIKKNIPKSKSPAARIPQYPANSKKEFPKKIGPYNNDFQLEKLKKKLLRFLINNNIFFLNFYTFF